MKKQSSKRFVIKSMTKTTNCKLHALSKHQLMETLIGCAIYKCVSISRRENWIVSSLTVNTVFL